MSNQTFAKSVVVLIMFLFTMAILCGLCSCKAWRTITTTATYTEQNDSVKQTTTISTKTVEEYQGVKKK